MDDEKRERLEAAGWKVGSAAEFLGLSDEEAASVETRASQGSSPGPDPSQPPATA